METETLKIFYVKYKTTPDYIKTATVIATSKSKAYTLVDDYVKNDWGEVLSVSEPHEIKDSVIVSYN